MTIEAPPKNEPRRSNNGNDIEHKQRDVVKGLEELKKDSCREAKEKSEMGGGITR